MFEQVANGFQPLIDLASAASYPLGLFMFIVCGCQYMIGNELQAKKAAKCAVIGYIIVQMAPGIMRIIHNATIGLGTIK
jgi:hypothetical protein